MSVPSASEVERFLVAVLTDLDEAGIDRTPMAIIGRASDRTGDPDMIRVIADLSEDAAAVLRAHPMETREPERSPAP